jgi:hypothetical protein
VNGAVSPENPCYKCSSVDDAHKWTLRSGGCSASLVLLDQSFFWTKVVIEVSIHFHFR